MIADNTNLESHSHVSDLRRLLQNSHTHSNLSKGPYDVAPATSDITAEIREHFKGTSPGEEA